MEANDFNDKKKASLVFTDSCTYIHIFECKYLQKHISTQNMAVKPHIHIFIEVFPLTHMRMLKKSVHVYMDIYEVVPKSS